MVSVVVEKTPFFAVWQGRKKVSSMSQNPFQGHPERMNECVFCVLHGRWKSSEQGGANSIFDAFKSENAQKVWLLSRVCGFGMFVFLMLHESHLLDRSVQVVENKPFRRMSFMNKRFSFSCFSCFLRGTYFTPYIYIIDY